jgi:hypothetical protein
VKASPVLLLAAAGGWLAVLVFLLTFVAARRWFTAGLLASVQVITAWAFVAAVAIGPADVRLRWTTHPLAVPGVLRYDYGQAAGWVSGKPWELFGVVAGVFAWCLLWHRLRRRRRARRQAADIAAAMPAPVQVMPAYWPPPVPPDRGARR